MGRVGFLTCKLQGICFLHKSGHLVLSCYEAGFVLYFVCIFISDSYFMASLLMHLIILARGGVGLKMFNFESFFSVIFTLSLFFWVCFGEFTQI